MNLTDYPTPKSDAAEWMTELGTSVVCYDVSAGFEREAAAWKAVAEMLYARVEADRYRSYNGVESDAAMEAFDALKSQLEKP